MNTYGLSERSYNELMTILGAVPHIDEAIIYGSRARGDFWRVSDVDLSLKGEHLTRSDIVTLDDMLYESHIPFFFDLNIYNEIHNPAFKSNVDRDGIVIYRKQQNEHED